MQDMVYYDHPQVDINGAYPIGCEPGHGPASSQECRRTTSANRTSTVHPPRQPCVEDSSLRDHDASSKLVGGQLPVSGAQGWRSTSRILAHLAGLRKDSAPARQSPWPIMAVAFTNMAHVAHVLWGLSDSSSRTSREVCIDLISNMRSADIPSQARTTHSYCT